MIEMTLYNHAFSIQFCVIHLRCYTVLHALVYYSGILFTRVFALCYTVISRISCVFPSWGTCILSNYLFLA